MQLFADSKLVGGWCLDAVEVVAGTVQDWDGS